MLFRVLLLSAAVCTSLLAADNEAEARRLAQLNAIKALREAPLDQARPILADFAKQYDGKDPAHLAALVEGCTGKEDAMYAHLLGKMGGPAAKWSDAFADIATALHPLNALPALKDRALAASVTLERRKQAIEAIAKISDKAATAALNDIASKGPEDARAFAQEALKKR